MHHRTRLMFVFIVEMWFHCVGQAGLELLTSIHKHELVIGNLASENKLTKGEPETWEGRTIVGAKLDVNWQNLVKQTSASPLGSSWQPSPLGETVSHRVSQASLELPVSSDPPTLASQSSG
ncbi:hypothetical protein AAY473_019444, partial [Plecturocebus cupreus]